MTRTELALLAVDQFEREVKGFDSMEYKRALQCCIALLIGSIYTLYVAYALTPFVLIALPFAFLLTYKALRARFSVRWGVFEWSVTEALITQSETAEEIVIGQYQKLKYDDKLLEEMEKVSGERRKWAMRLYKCVFAMTIVYPIAFAIRAIS